MDIFSKLKFFLKKPKVIIVAGQGSDCAREAIEQVLKAHFNFGQEILLFDFSEPRDFKFLAENSSLPMLVVTHIGDIPADKDFFTGEKEKIKEVVNLAKILPSHGRLILNYDDEAVREIKDEISIKEITFGFGKGADFRASDVILNSETNFKINERGNVVPVWLKGLFGKEHIYSALASAVVGVILGLNLVEISQALKDYQPPVKDKK